MKHLILIIATVLLIGCESDPIIVEPELIELTTQEKLIGHWSTDRQAFSMTYPAESVILEGETQYECIIENVKFHTRLTYYYLRYKLGEDEFKDYSDTTECNTTMYYILSDKTIAFTNESGSTKIREILKITKDSLIINIPYMPRNKGDYGILKFSKIN